MRLWREQKQTTRQSCDCHIGSRYSATSWSRTSKVLSKSVSERLRNEANRLIAKLKNFPACTTIAHRV